jgi:hypothetical protein
MRIPRFPLLEDQKNTVFCFSKFFQNNSPNQNEARLEVNSTTNTHAIAIDIFLEYHQPRQQKKVSYEREEQSLEEDEENNDVSFGVRFKLYFFPVVFSMYCNVECKRNCLVK